MNETTIDISEFSQITDITVADGDNLLLSRADGTAAKVSLAALKTLLGRVFASAAALSTETNARATADTGLTNLLKGKIDSGALAGQHPFVMLGDFETWDDVNEALDTLATDTTAYKYTGRVRFSKTGANYECMMHVLSYQNAVWVQTCSGPLSVSGGKLAAGDAFAKFHRRCESGTLGAWKPVNATPEELASEATRATTAETAIKQIANGTSSENVWNMALKVVAFSDGASGLIPTINNLLVDTSKNTHGTYLLRYSSTGSNLLLLQGGLNIDTFPTNASRGVTQIVIGNVIVSARPDIAGTGTTWADAGVPNGVAVGHGSTNVLCRRLYYSGTTRVITPWREYVSNYANVSSAQNLEISDVVMRPLYLAGNTPIAMQGRKVSYNASTGMYSLNGLTDITPSEMLAVYEATHVKIPADPRGLFNSCAMRTNMPWNVYNIQAGNAGGNLTSEYFGADNMFARCSSLEVVEFCSQDLPARFHSYRMCFNLCLKLRRVGRMDFNYITSASSASTVEPKPRTLFRCFYGCAELEEVRIENLKISGLSFADSPNLSAASVAYLVANAANTSAITVTVNGNTLLYISAGQDEWAGIEEAAAARNITFVS